MALTVGSDFTVLKNIKAYCIINCLVEQREAH
jgi:hypothetical protein